MNPIDIRRKWLEADALAEDVFGFYNNNELIGETL